MLIALMYLVVSFLAMVLSMVIVIRSPRSRTSWAYLIYSVSSILWLSGVFLDRVPADILLLHFRSLFVFALIMSISLLVFINSLTKTKLTRFSFLTGLLLSSFVAYASIATDSITSSVVRSNGLVVPERGSLYPFAISWILAIGVYSIYVLVRMYRRASNYNRQQALIILTGYVSAFVMASLTTVVLPNFTGDNQYNDLAPFSSAVLTSLLAYAVVKHGFLDIRLIAVRALGYLLLSIILGSVYIVFSLLVLGRLLDISLTIGQQVAVFIFIVFTMASVRKLNPIIVKASRKLFYHTYYDAREVAERVTNLSVKSHDFDRLTSGYLWVLNDVFNPERVSISVLGHDGSLYRHEGLDGMTSTDRNELFLGLSRIDESTLYVDLEPAEDARRGGVHGLLKASGLDISVKLVNNGVAIGYLLIGPKKSGNPYSQRDIKVISATGNEIAVALQNARRYEQIEQFAETLQEEVQVATRKLKRSNEKLKALDEAKDEFISMASHQLRTPLTSIKGYISMVMDGDAGKVTKQQAELLDQAFISSQRMVYLIADLLNVSRLRTGKFVIDRSPTDLAEIVSSEVRQLKETVKVRGLKISYTPPAKRILYNLDETKIRQVVMNFIDNAVYYTPKGGLIEVDIKSTRKKLEFKVRDNGIGVAKSDVPSLFTKFYRAGNARKARPDGTGLGLYMAKKVIVAQGGSVIFKSKEGKGSTFGFTFPMDKVKID